MKRNIMLKIFLIVMISLVTISIIPLVSAVFWACFDYGETRYYCDNYKPPKTCGSSPRCMICMSVYDEAEDCYVHAYHNLCNYIPPGCSTYGNGTIDSSPPELIVNSPVQDEFYDSRSVLVDIEVNEESDIYFYDNINGRGLWTRICTDCMGYNNFRSFDEGINNITIRAKDVVGNAAYHNLTFYVDSAEPKIHDTLPDYGEYTNGVFTVEYTEMNLKDITLYYQQEGQELQSIAKTDCPKGEKQICVFDVGTLDGEFSLDYYFGVSDNAQTVFSEQKTVFVDTIIPELEVFSPHNPILVYNDRKISVDIDVSEIVLLEYIDYEDRNPRWKRLCKNCDEHNKTKSFGDGFHNVTFRATDNAGNVDEEERPFIVDSKAPKISKTEPRRGYATGDFMVQFREDNPEQITLHYGNDDTGYEQADVTNCYEDRGKHTCTVEVSLDAYNGQEIEYWFVVRDIANYEDQKGKTGLKVDTTFPLFEKLDAVPDGRYVYFDIEVSEEVDIEYTDNGGNVKTLCSNCDSYNKKKSFSRGSHTLWIQATDEAGNAISQSIDFEIDY